MALEPYYADELVTLYNADCLDVLPHLSDVDLVFTSPPYNLGVSPGGQWGHWKAGQPRGGGKSRKWGGVGESGISYACHDDAMPIEDYTDWQRGVLGACWASLSDQGAIYYNHKPRPQKTGLWLPLTLNSDLTIRQIVTWWRGSGVNFSTTYYVPTYEWLIVFARDGFRLRSRGASGVGDVWQVLPDRGNAHPAPFPVALPARAIETTAPGLVVDPMCGSGSTLIAAKQAGVRAVGIEINESYCEIAVHRLEASQDCKEGA